MKLQRLHIRKGEVFLLAPMFFLVIVGVLVQFSLSATDRSGLVASPLTHLISVAIGIAVMFVTTALPLTIWPKIARLFYGVVIVMLVCVLTFGPEVFGAKRWLLFSGFQIQPSEIMKPALAFMTAYLLVRKVRSNRQWFRIVSLLSLLGIPVLLVLLQPDIGTSLVLVAIWVAEVVTTSTVSWRQLAIMVAALVMVVVLCLPFMSPYQRARVTSFIGGHSEDDASSYNVVQARIAVGSGGVFGQGLSGGTQSQLSFLPARHTDFVFAVVAEKLGILGALGVVVAEGCIALRAWQIVKSTKKLQPSLVAAGMASVFLVQAIVNTSMNIGLLPVTGIPLPFVSYGGTSMIVSMFMVGWLLKLDSANRSQDLFTG